MRWWLNTDHKAFSVDNAFVRDGMDYSSLPPNLWMIQWTDGKGEIEYQDPTGINPNGVLGVNLNGLRVNFIDLTPYVQFFQQFLILMKSNVAQPLTLFQAQKVQCDLITELFNSKRQVPYHYIVGAGDYWWNVSKDARPDTTAPGQDLSDALSQTNDAVNTLANNDSLLYDNDSSLSSGTTNVVAQVNANVVGTINSNASIANSLTAQVNTNIVSGSNSALAATGNNFISFINNTSFAQIEPGLFTTVLLTFIDHDGNSQTVHGAPGTSAAIPRVPYTFGNLSDVSGTSASSPNVNDPTTAPSAPTIPPALPVIGGPAAAPPAQWVPYGGTATVPVTSTEQDTINVGITNQTQSLTTTKNSKIAAVNALTTIDAVIAYDVTAGWPSVPTPPGYGPIAPATYRGEDYVTMTTPPPTGGVPEAPTDGLMYGRQSAAWHRALAITGDLLDGGNF